MKTVIVTGGKAPSDNLLFKEIKEADTIIAADKGCEVLHRQSIKPNIILGDFDSVSDDVLKYYRDEVNDVYVYPTEKDFTDTELAFNKAIEMGSDEIVILGATGSRLDHVLGSLGLLYKGLIKGVKTFIKDDNNIIFLVNEPQRLKGKVGQIISFQGFREEVRNFSIIGAKYDLHNYNLNIGEPLTVSNEFLKGYIDVKFDSGNLLVIYSND